MEYINRRIAELLSLVFVIFLIVSETQNGTTALVSYYLYCFSTSSNINEGIVKATFDRTFSKLHCGIHCSSLSALSFYFEDNISTCHCNNKTDEAAEPDNTSAGMTYCAVINRAGTPSECQALYDVGFRSTKVCTIGRNDIQICCDMSALGWIVFQRRQDGNVNFLRNWTEYVSGFGDENGEFWMGLEAIHQKTVNGCELHIYLEAEPGSTVQDSGYARYSSFTLGGDDTFYTLMVDGFLGNVGDSLSFSNGIAFSTYDADHDPDDSDFCSQRFNACWWMKNCFRSSLNGAYMNEEFGEGLIWHLPWGFYYSLRRTEMAFRCDAEPHV